MKSIILPIISIFISLSSFAQWQQTHGPTFAGDAKCILFKGTDVFASPSGAIYKTSNNGASWQSQNKGLLNPEVWAIASLGSTLFIGTGVGTTPAGVYASTDNGNTWNLRNIGLPSNVSVQCFAINGSTLHAAMWNGGVYTSTNNAMSWTAASSGLPVSYMISIAAFGNSVLAGTIYDGLYLSSDNGANWTQVSGGMTSNVRVNAFAVSGSTVFAATMANSTNPGGIFKSVDNGNSWAACGTSGLTNMAIMSIVVNGNDIIIGTGGGIFRSTDGANTWVSINNGLNDSFGPVAASGNTLYAGGQKNIYVSTNNGNSWSACNTGISCMTTKPLFVNGNDLYVGSYYETGSYVTHDGGVIWNKIDTTLVGDVNVYAVNGSSLYAGTESNGLYRSIGNAATWTKCMPDSIMGNPLRAINDIAFCGNKQFIATQGKGIFSSADGGATWIKETSFPLGYVSTLAVKGNTLFAGGANGIYSTTDNGTTWNLLGISTGWVFTIGINGNDIYVGCLDLGAFISSDSGLTWTNINTSGLPYRINNYAFSGNSIFAATWGQGVFLSNNKGVSWTPINTDLCNTSIWDIAITGGNVYASTTGGGVWKRPASDFALGLQENIKDNEGVEIYPNPFNVTTDIVFEKEVNKVTIKITDVLGKEMQSQNFSGKNLQIKKGNLIPGVYFVNIISENNIITKKNYYQLISRQYKWLY